MTPLAPLGLLALLAGLPIAAAYFLRRRQPPRVVSALFLWRQTEQHAEAGAKLERFSREASLLLELLAVVLAAIFLADLRLATPKTAPHVVVVLDGSLSMRARSGGDTAAERAKAVVLSQLGRASGAVATVIESGLKPVVLAGPRADERRVKAALAAWQPNQPAHDLATALALAREMSSLKEQRVLLVTDGPVPDSLAVPPNVDVTSVGRAVDNVAFVAAQRHDEGGAARVTLRVTNFGAGSADVPVRLTLDDGGVREQPLRLAAGQSGVVRLEAATAGPVQARLPDDALLEDGQLTLLPSAEAQVSLGALSGLDPLAKATLERLVAAAPAVAFGSAPQLTVGPPGSSALLTVGAAAPLTSFVGPFFAQKGHPLLDDVELGGVVWTAGANPPGRPLLSAGAAVLASEEEDGRLHLNVELSKSNVQRTPAWPVLLMNAARQARGRLHGFPRKQLMLGEDVAVVTRAGVVTALEGPHGERRPVVGVGPLALPPLPSPGRWRLLEDGAPVDELEVMAVDPHESNLRTRGPFELAATQGQPLASEAAQLPRATWPLVALLAVLALDFVLTASRRRRAGEAVSAT